MPFVGSQSEQNGTPHQIKTDFDAGSEHRVNKIMGDVAQAWDGVARGAPITPKRRAGPPQMGLGGIAKAKASDGR